MRSKNVEFASAKILPKWFDFEGLIPFFECPVVENKQVKLRSSSIEVNLCFQFWIFFENFGFFVNFENFEFFKNFNFFENFEDFELFENLKNSNFVKGSIAYLV